MAGELTSLSLSRGVGLVTPGGGEVIPQIPWTPAMVGVREYVEAVDAATILTTGGGQAIAGQPVATWKDKSSNARDLTTISAGTTDPVLGSGAEASPTGVVPVLFRDTKALQTAVIGANETTFTTFLLARMNVVGAEAKWALSYTPDLFVLLHSSSTVAGQVRPLGALSPDALEVNTAQRMRMFTLRNTPTVVQGVAANGVSRMNGSETALDNLSISPSTASGQRMVLGNRAASRTATTGANMDVFAYANVPAALSRANEQRMEGYFAHRAGLQSVLDSAHPYKTAPPTVPEGTTSTADWLDVDNGTALQTFLGGYIELQPDSFNGGTTTPAIDGSTDVWGFPYSLTTSEKARLRDTIMPGGGAGLKYIRFPLGFAYRGARVVDGTSGLIKQLGERFSGQNAAITDLIANVVNEGGGLAPEYWSPAPHWKTTSTFGNGTLWAGAAYSRATTLDSIRISDPTQYAAQIAALTDAILNDLEYLHANVGPVRMFGLQNEPVTSINENYGTCSYTDVVYRDVWKSLIPKIRNSSPLSTWGGNANTVLLHANSWSGFLAGAAGSGIVSDVTVLSTGKTLVQELWGTSYHYITEIAADADYIRGNAATWRATAPTRNHFTNEFEYFTPGDYTAERRFANTVLQMLYNFVFLSSAIVMPIIHISKQVGQNTSQSNTDGYALTRVRLPVPFGQDPSTPGDPDPTLDHGHFDFVEENWKASQFVLDNIKAGSVRRKTSLGNVVLPAGVSAASFTRPDGKRGFAICNRNTSPYAAKLETRGLSFQGTRYRHDGVTSLSTPSGPVISLSVPANSAEIWLA